MIPNQAGFSEHSSLTKQVNLGQIIPNAVQQAPQYNSLPPYNQQPQYNQQPYYNQQPPYNPQPQQNVPSLQNGPHHQHISNQSGNYIPYQQPVQRSAPNIAPNNQMPHGHFTQQQELEQEKLEIQSFFYKVAGIDRNIDRQEFIQILVLAYPNLRKHPQIQSFTENLFRLCDLNNNGFIDLKEFMIGFSRFGDQLDTLNDQFA